MIDCSKCGPKENWQFCPGEVKRALTGKAVYCRMCQKQNRDRNRIRAGVPSASWHRNNRLCLPPKT